MKRYTITITPDNGRGAATVVKLEVNGTTPRITELNIKADPNTGLSASQLPAIDLEMLLAAIMPATGVVPAVTAAPPVSPKQAGVPAPAISATAAAPAAKAATARKPAKKAQPGTARKAPAAQTPAPRKGRAYRTMPDDFIASFGKTTMTDLADVYEVPRHTIQGWVTTARKQGKLPPAHTRSTR